MDYEFISNDYITDIGGNIYDFDIILNLNKIQSFIDKKNVKTSEILNSNLLKKLKLINKRSSKLKILGSGEIKDKINIEADLASKSAVNKLEKIGGSIQIKK